MYVTIASPYPQDRGITNANRMPTVVVLISQGELKVINTDPHNKKEKCLVPVTAPRGEMMLVYSNIVESQQCTTVTKRKSRDMQCSECFFKGNPGSVVSLTDSEEEESAFWHRCSSCQRLNPISNT